MSKNLDPIHVAALELCATITPENRRTGTTGNVLVWRTAFDKLATALDEEYPGALERTARAIHGPKDLAP